MREVMVRIYKYNELPDKIKETVRQRILDDGWLVDDIRTDIIDNCKEVLQANGLSGLCEDIRWSLGGNQGDGIAFYGPIDLEEFLDKQDLWNEFTFMSLNRSILSSINVSIQSNNKHYDHYNTMYVDHDLDSLDSNYIMQVERKEILDLFDVLLNKLKDLSKQLEKEGYGIIDRLESEDNVCELFMCNDFEFYEDGNLFKA